MTKPSCPHRPPCPGCPRFGELGICDEAHEQLAALCTSAGIELPATHEGPPWGFRLRARLSVRGRPNSPKIGIFQEGSHRIVDLPRCPIHHPLINEVSAAVKNALRETGTQPYIESSHRGLLRAIQVVVERRSQKAQVVLVTRGESAAEIGALSDRLRQSLRDSLHSLWWNGNPERTNSVLGPLWERLYGPEAVEESVAGARVFFPPGAFGQSNLTLFDEIAARVHSWVPDGSRAIELYGGCGSIGLGLLPGASSVLFNELSEASLQGLAQGLAQLDPTLYARAEIVPGPAAALADSLNTHDVVIADPPRKGLDPAVLEALCANPPERFIYVACEVRAFLRDAGTLLESGRLSLTALEPFALFPYTEHVEVTALFERRTEPTPS